jgi:hypothetical protein
MTSWMCEWVFVLEIVLACLSLCACISLCLCICLGFCAKYVTTCSDYNREERRFVVESQKQYVAITVACGDHFRVQLPSSTEELFTVGYIFGELRKHPNMSAPFWTFRLCVNDPCSMVMVKGDADASELSVQVDPHLPVVLFYEEYQAFGDDKAELVRAVRDWCAGGDAKDACRETYGHISSWNTSAVTDMSGLFLDQHTFDEDLSRWDVSRVTDMSSMFRFALIFNGDIGKWDVSRVTAMENMFLCAVSFNCDLHKWDVSKVTTMFGMFHRARDFNGDVSRWSVSNVTTMGMMFLGATTFNRDVSKWDVSHVEFMSQMFQDATHFNCNIRLWDVRNVWLADGMFKNATAFDCDICGWNTSEFHNAKGMFAGASTFQRHYVIGWNLASLRNGTTFLDLFE